MSDGSTHSEQSFSEKLERLQERLRYEFNDRRILLQALTHTSYGFENGQDLPLSLRNNERLEFLGDAILDVIISDILLEMYPNSNEGQLSKMRAAVVNEKTLDFLSRQIKLSDHLRLGKGELQTGGAEKPSIVSSALEALIAAVYLDGGFHAVFPVVRHLFRRVLVMDTDTFGSVPFQDYKSRLQEVVQARWKVTPSYRLMDATGPAHARVFQVEVYIKEMFLGSAQGNNKKEAEQNAAQAALECLDQWLKSAENKAIPVRHFLDLKKVVEIQGS